MSDKQLPEKKAAQQLARITRQRAEALMKRMASCDLCPRRCGVNRLQGETGFCGLDSRLIVSHVLPHHGEEPPISGEKGAGTIFFSSCNLRCSFCQNYQISHEPKGRVMDADALALAMLGLQQEGCHNIEAVTPTPQLPLFLEAISRACDRGLDLPIVYNCGGYEDPEIIQLLDGIVDIYLPDFKYGDAPEARLFSGVSDYHHYALLSLREMVKQCGDDLVLERDIAKRGVLIRHLVLPGKTENSFDVLRAIKREISTTVPISLMAQYTPTAPVRDDPLLGRRITKDEYEIVVEYALDLGFETIFTQEVDEKELTPDFNKKEPFQFNA